MIQHIHNISQHIILISTAAAFYGQFKVLAAFIMLCWGNNFSSGEMQRPILVISMVDKIDPTYTQHITAYNIYLNCICLLRPIQSTRGIYPVILGNNFSPGELQRPIYNMFMVDEIDPRYTQNITTYNTFLNCICLLRPIQSARGVYPVILEKNKFSPWEMQPPIFNISMVDKFDPRYTQHITTCNIYLNCTCFLLPIQSARSLYACYIKGNDFYPG